MWFAREAMKAMEVWSFRNTGWDRANCLPIKVRQPEKWRLWVDWTPTFTFMKKPDNPALYCIDAELCLSGFNSYICMVILSHTILFVSPVLTGIDLNAAD